MGKDIRTNDRIEHWLIALRAPGLAGRRLIDAIQVAGGIDRLAEAPAGPGFKAEAREAIRKPDRQLLESDLEWLDQPGHHLLSWDDEDYPPLLRRISSPPAALFVDGDPDVLWQPQIAIIGSRNPTTGGIDHARAFGAAFSQVGMTVTSGLASGIDAAAHQAALEAGGCTVAVTGTGLDRVYPRSSEDLATRIRTQGALVSELPLGSAPLKPHFPARNRIISGLSFGVLVIEAGLNSGTLITARQAADQGRDVFALPGSLHNPMVKGCHRLIREGARLVETVDDVMSELAPLISAMAIELAPEPASGGEPPRVDPPGNEPDDPDYQSLLAALEYDPRTANELVRLTGLPVQSVSSMLLMLELQDRVRVHSSGRYSLVRARGGA
jgi:DNA processing protein